MTALRERVEQLADDVSWFARVPELRLHLVLVDEDVRAVALRLIARGSKIVEGRVPYVILVDPYVGEDGGWPGRASGLDDAYTVVRHELQRRGERVYALPALSTTAPSPAAAFGLLVGNVLQTAGGALTGLVVVLAPDRVDALERFAAEVSALVRDAHVAQVRWVVVLPDGTPLAPLVTELGADGALVTDCRTTDAEGTAALAEMVENAERAPPEAAPLAHAGMAWPQQAPPPRPNAKVRPVDPADEARRTARKAMLRGALELRERKPEALTALREAYDSFARAGLVDEQLAVHFLLATSVATVGDPQRAIDALEAVQAEATTHGRPFLVAQVATARGTLQAALGDAHGGIHTYGEAITAARAAGSEALPLLIELLRLTGQLCVATGYEEQAVALWREAIALGETRPPEVSPESAVQAARALAELCRKRGLHPQAASLDAQADALAKPKLADAVDGMAAS